jgi:peptide deformylase
MAVAVPETHFETIRANFANIGVRQFGDPVLRRNARPIKLPSEAALASEILDCLLETIKSARRLHDFERGVGLAAPQIGLSRRVAVVQPADELPILLINPRIIKRSRKTEVRLEGCLSFFDYRGEVRRPVSVTVEFDDIHGRPRQMNLKSDAARLALHEIDHLDGRLYIDLMRPSAKLFEDDGQHP